MAKADAARYRVAALGLSGESRRLISQLPTFIKIRMRVTLFSTLAPACLAALAAFAAAPQGSGQKTDAPASNASTQKAGEKQAAKVDEKALVVVERAVRAMGGGAY